MKKGNHTISCCRFCRSKLLTEYLDLGFTPLADCFLTSSQLDDPETYYPLRLVVCESCGLHQLSYSVDPRVLYQNHYPYESSFTKTALSHYGEFARSVSQQFHLDAAEDLVLDIGSNAGTLLKGFQMMGMRTLGVDPAKEIAQRASKNGIDTIPDFFSQKVARLIRDTYGRPKVIVATNVFAHIFDHHDFMKALLLMFRKDSIFIFESPYLKHIVDNLEYDTIYHEHLLYLSLKPVVEFMDKFGLQVFSVEKYPIHGGSCRVYCCKKGERTVNPNVYETINEEDRKGLYSKDRLTTFASAVHDNRTQLYSLLMRLKKKGKRIGIVSAPAKGMTLLNYCHIGPDLVDFATEKSPLKIGRYTPGVHIPIFSDGELTRRKPDYVLLLAWNFSSEIMKNLSRYKHRGGKFIIPIPRPKII